MRLASLYKFYQSHFGYGAAADRQRIAFGRAVADCMRVLHDVYRERNLSPVFQYRESNYPRQLTLHFLDNLQRLVQARFENFFESLTYYEYEIVIDVNHLAPTRRRGLQIASPFLWNQGRNEIIFLTFSAPNNMALEMGVFVTLAEALSERPMPVAEVQQYTYWDVVNGSECSLVRPAVTPAPVATVIETCNSILSG